MVGGTTASPSYSTTVPPRYCTSHDCLAPAVASLPAAALLSAQRYLVLFQTRPCTSIRIGSSNSLPQTPLVRPSERGAVSSQWPPGNVIFCVEAFIFSYPPLPSPPLLRTHCLCQVLLESGYLAKEPAAARPVVYLAVIDESGGPEYHDAMAEVCVRSCLGFAPRFRSRVSLSFAAWIHTYIRQRLVCVYHIL